MTLSYTLNLIMRSSRDDLARLLPYMEYLFENFLKTYVYKGCKFDLESFVFSKMSQHFVKSSKGKDVFLYNGHEYIFKRANFIEDKKIWRCRMVNKFKCPATVITKNGNVIKEPNEHSHDGDPVGIQKSILVSKITDKACSSQQTTRSIIGATLVGVQNDVLARLPKKSTLEKSIQRHRQSSNAAIPNPRNLNFSIPTQYEDMLLYDTGIEDHRRILVLGERELLMKLGSRASGEPLIWFGDGTFKVVPELFFQLYTVHTKIGVNYPPCIYFLLPDKTENTYRRMVDILKELLPDIIPDIILLDFEKAAHNAFQSGYIDSDISGCFFI